MRVLLALDGSEIGERAAAAISDWVHTSGSELELLSVFDAEDVHETVSSPGHTYSMTPRGAYSGTPLNVREPKLRTAEDRSQAIERAHAEREDYLHAIARRYFGDVQPTVHVKSADHAADAIVEAAKELDVDFAVVGSHGRSGIGKALVGSVAERVIRECAVPVLVVGPGAQVALKQD